VANTAILALEDGTVFKGQSIGVSGQTVGEVVFNTAITGYQEILTDPSYAKQIVTLTYPHIGNTGTNPQDVESPGIYAAGLVIRDLPRRVSNWRSTQSLSEYLSAHNIVAIADIDTRKLTRLLREKGAQNGSIVAGDSIDDARAVDAARAFPGLKGMDLAREVTTAEPYVWRNGGWGWDHNAYRDAAAVRFNVVAFDFGVKQNILRMLVDRGCAVQVIPATTTAEQVLAQHPDGVFLSNGPGDPEPCDYAIAAIRGILEANVPVFGICLGHQLLSLASGAKTMKMKFGHHGANHPVQDLKTKQVFITSQNHGFTVDAENLPDHLQVTHTSLFDGSIQGVARTDRPAFSFQGHPEASPGPHDIALLFDRFVELMAAHQGADTGTTKALGSHA
jgi:carbamoyl-phosphate synthase small subunit